MGFIIIHVKLFKFQKLSLNRFVFCILSLIINLASDLSEILLELFAYDMRIYLF